MSTDRIEWIDRAKGIAIILVLFGHFCCCLKVTAIIYAFHMPLFFFLSGIVFNYEKNKQFRLFFNKKVRTLLIPLFIFNLVYLIWLTVRCLLIGNFENHGKHIIGIFLQHRGTDYSCGAWFISCIFLAEILLYCTIRICKNNKIYLMIAAGIYIALGLIYSYKIRSTLPWNIDASLVAVFFMLIGYCLKHIISMMNSRIVYILSIPLVILSLFNYQISNNQRIEMSANIYCNIPLFLITAFCGIIFFIQISKRINNSFITYLGKNSLFFYGGQLVFASLFSDIANKYNFFWLPAQVSILLGVFITIFVFAILLLTMKYYNMLLGKINRLIQ